MNSYVIVCSFSSHGCFISVRFHVTLVHLLDGTPIPRKWAARLKSQNKFLMAPNRSCVKFRCVSLMHTRHPVRESNTWFFDHETTVGTTRPYIFTLVIWDITKYLCSGNLSKYVLYCSIYRHNDYKEVTRVLFWN